MKMKLQFIMNYFIDMIFHSTTEHEIDTRQEKLTNRNDGKYPHVGVVLLWSTHRFLSKARRSHNLDAKLTRLRSSSPSIAKIYWIGMKCWGYEKLWDALRKDKTKDTFSIELSTTWILVFFGILALSVPNMWYRTRSRCRKFRRRCPVTRFCLARLLGLDEKTSVECTNILEFTANVDEVLLLVVTALAAVPRFSQREHLQLPPHKIPAWKHSQYLWKEGRI